MVRVRDRKVTSRGGNIMVVMVRGVTHLKRG